jgi:cytochrome c-type biogenesis protein CcmI
MGLFSRLLTLPLEPVRGAVWVAETLQQAAEQEYYDEGQIRRQLLDLENDLSAGRISEPEYEAAEEELVARLLEGQQRAAPAQPDTTWSGSHI